MEDSRPPIELSCPALRWPNMKRVEAFASRRFGSQAIHIWYEDHGMVIHLDNDAMGPA